MNGKWFKKKPYKNYKNNTTHDESIYNQFNACMVSSWMMLGILIDAWNYPHNSSLRAN